MARRRRLRHRKLIIRASLRPAITINREVLRAEKLVYIATVNRRIRYEGGRSRIAYIGTTQRGVGRIAGSAAHKARLLLRIYGLKELSFHVVTCSARPGTQAWRRLERALLVAFKNEYKEPPIGNRQGKNFEPRDEYKYFRTKRLRAVIERYSRDRQR